MFTEALLDIQEILDRNYQIEKEWRDFFFQQSNPQATLTKENQK